MSLYFLTNGRMQYDTMETALLFLCVVKMTLSFIVERSVATGQDRKRRLSTFGPFIPHKISSGW